MAVYAYNRRASFDYELLEKFEAGIELTGEEVKPIRNGRMSLEGSFVLISNKEAQLMNATIPPYQPNNTSKDYDPLRSRKILLTKKEIAHLESIQKNSNLTVVPISVYNKGRKIKVEIALAKGKKKRDKRETIKKRETDREIRREYKGR